MAEGRAANDPAEPSVEPGPELADRVFRILGLFAKYDAQQDEAKAPPAASADIGYSTSAQPGTPANHGARTPALVQRGEPPKRPHPATQPGTPSRRAQLQGKYPPSPRAAPSAGRGAEARQPSPTPGEGRPGRAAPRRAEPEGRANHGSPRGARDPHYHIGSGEPSSPRLRSRSPPARAPTDAGEAAAFGRQYSWVLFPGKNGALEGPAVVVGRAEEKVYIDHGGTLICMSSDQVLPAGSISRQREKGLPEASKQYSQTTGGWHEYLEDTASTDS